jgi:hypothetical protein
MRWGLTPDPFTMHVCRGQGVVSGAELGGNLSLKARRIRVSIKGEGAIQSIEARVEGSIEGDQPRLCRSEERSRGCRSKRGRQ